MNWKTLTDRYSILLGCLAFSCTGLAQAQQNEQQPAAATTPRPPSPEGEQLRFFVGRWSCQGQQFATEFGSARRTTAAVAITSVLDGFWYALQVRSGKFQGTGYWGYDASSKRFITTFVSNMGDMENWTATGWKGNDFTWAGDTVFKGRKVPLRETLTRKGDGEFFRIVELSGSSGQWTRVAEEKCRL